MFVAGTTNNVTGAASMAAGGEYSWKQWLAQSIDPFDPPLTIAPSFTPTLSLARGVFVAGYRNVVSDAKAVVAGGEHR